MRYLQRIRRLIVTLPIRYEGEGSRYDLQRYVTPVSIHSREVNTRDDEERLLSRGER